MSCLGRMLPQTIRMDGSRPPIRKKLVTKKDLVSFEFAPDNEKNKYLILSKKGVDVFNVHKEQQEHIEKAIFSVLRNYSEEDLQMVMKLMDDVEQVWRELPW